MKCVCCNDDARHTLTYENVEGVKWTGDYCDKHFRQKLRQWADVLYSIARDAKKEK